jgi:ubiquinone/menaquinone biosynthesis C-methylase UbiE
MGGASSGITDHYTQGDLLARLLAALRADGVDPDHPTVAALAPYDHFHGRGLEATEDMFALVHPKATDHVLDVGSGIGGPARYVASRFGCRVTGIDLTAEFCAVARQLTRLVGLQAQVAIEEGNALRMPFGDAAFDGAYSMNVAMNIADKAGFYGEICRVLKPGGWLALSEVALGPAGPPDYPTPWAASAETSFLATPAETHVSLAAAGFTIVHSRETVQEVIAYGAKARALVAAGGKPPQRTVQLIHGDRAAAIMANTAQGTASGRLIPLEILCRR